MKRSGSFRQRRVKTAEKTVDQGRGQDTVAEDLSPIRRDNPRGRFCSECDKEVRDVGFSFRELLGEVSGDLIAFEFRVRRAVPLISVPVT
jgi:hypothetical protein